MVEKKELIRGSIEELEDYFYNELGVVKYSEDHIKNEFKDIENMEMGVNNSIQKQLLELSLLSKSIGIICYLNSIKEKDNVIVRIKSDFVFIVDKNQEELFIKGMLK